VAFNEDQKQALSRKLNPRYVRTRVSNGRKLAYVEGWHAIAEANRIFGFDAWDRETIQIKCVWEGTHTDREACTYMARVRIRVRAGGILVIRVGSGTGHGIGRTHGEAHDNALKVAETDAMKRALATFGNPFGLALYDSEKRGVRKETRRSGSPTSETPFWTIYSANSDRISATKNPVVYCKAVRKHIQSLSEPRELKAFWKRNLETVSKLEIDQPDLKSKNGRHYVQTLIEIYNQRLLEIDQRESNLSKDENLAKQKPKNPRSRDPIHLKYVASRPCIICGSRPSHAHHIRFAQPRAIGRKVGDEWTVPLCSRHHRSLHDFGNEKEWWKRLEIDPLEEATRLRYMTSSGKVSI
jgi:DNA recombination protein Rad52